jgi:F-box and WD-40 domain protein CDC4
MIVGMANSRIHIFDAPTARYKCTLVGHERGVWTLVLVSPSTPEPGDDDYPTSSSSRYSTPMPATGHSFSRTAGGGRASTRYRDDGLSRRASTGAGISSWQTPPTQSPNPNPQAESVYTYQPPNMGFDPTAPPLPSAGPSSAGYAVGPAPTIGGFGVYRSASSAATMQEGSTWVAGPPGMGGTAEIPPFGGSGGSGTSGGSGSGGEGGGREKTVHPTKRTRSSDVCGSARGWAEKGMGSRHLVVSGGCDRHVKVWDVATG